MIIENLKNKLPFKKHQLLVCGEKTHRICAKFCSNWIPIPCTHYKSLETLNLSNTLESLLMKICINQLKMNFFFLLHYIYAVCYVFDMDFTLKSSTFHGKTFSYWFCINWFCVRSAQQNANIWANYGGWWSWLKISCKTLQHFFLLFYHILLFASTTK